MHKYQPRVHVIRKDFSSELSPTKPVPTGEGVKTFSFPETVFTTVTAYQNQQVSIRAQHLWACKIACIAKTNKYETFLEQEFRRTLKSSVKVYVD